MRNLALLAALVACAATSTAHAAEECGRLENGFGPFDYRTATEKQRDTVERYHFTDNVATLRKGESTMRVGGDLDYTLRAFPNHPRALAAMAELALKSKKDPPEGARYTVACWFERAIRFRPEDGTVRTVWGIALLKSGERAEAIRQLEKADELLPNNPSVLYNLGLAHYQAKDYDRAVAYAKRAYELGFTLPGLRDMLKKVGKWP
jgi:Flp pilus assembly protein TadD